LRSLSAISPKILGSRPLPVWPLEGRKVQTSSPFTGPNSRPFYIILKTSLVVYEDYQRANSWAPSSFGLAARVPESCKFYTI